jgi:hypothetical protein
MALPIAAPACAPARDGANGDSSSLCTRSRPPGMLRADFSAGASVGDADTKPPIAASRAADVQFVSAQASEACAWTSAGRSRAQTCFANAAAIAVRCACFEVARQGGRQGAASVRRPFYVSRRTRRTRTSAPCHSSCSTVCGRRVSAGEQRTPAGAKSQTSAGGACFATVQQAWHAAGRVLCTVPSTRGPVRAVPCRRCSRVRTGPVRCARRLCLCAQRKSLPSALGHVGGGEYNAGGRSRERAALAIMPWRQ